MTTNPTTATFTDPTCGEVFVLVVPAGGRVYPPVSNRDDWEKIGVSHPRCGELADLSLDLDCFYCPACGWNGRISGAWAHDVIEGTRP